MICAKRNGSRPCPNDADTRLKWKKDKQGKGAMWQAESFCKRCTDIMVIDLTDEGYITVTEPLE
jgi:hypothetical protein